MKIQVWHANESLFRDSTMFHKNGKFFNEKDALKNFIFLDTYLKVEGGIFFEYAKTTEDVLEDVFGKTQNIHKVGWNDVKMCRSTSVGDIFEIYCDDGINYQIWIVASFGFEKLFERNI